MFYQTQTTRIPPKGPKMSFFVLGDFGLRPFTMTFKLIRARDQTRLHCEFGANPFSGSRDISYTTKKQTDGTKKQNNPQLTACCNKKVGDVTSLHTDNIECAAK